VLKLPGGPSQSEGAQIASQIIPRSNRAPEVGSCSACALRVHKPGPQFPAAVPRPGPTMMATLVTTKPGKGQIQNERKSRFDMDVSQANIRRMSIAIVDSDRTSVHRS